MGGFDSMNTMHEFINIVGEDNFSDKIEDLIPYSYDASINVYRPDALIWPETAEQISQIVTIANQKGVPIIPRGAGTSLSGGVLAIEGGIVIDVSKMDTIIEIKLEDRYATVQPGVICDDLNKELSKHNFIFPPDPASSSVATIGGNVATNAGGIKGAKYGTTRDYVLGLEVVIPTGGIMRTGAYTMKCVSGYDLPKLFAGSEGTLGIITEVTLKINPIPLHAMTAMATFGCLEDAGHAISETMTKSNLIPSVMEILDKVTLTSIRENTPIELPECEAMILTETDGYTWQEVEAQMTVILEILKKNNPLAIKTAKEEKERMELWEARKSAYATLSRISSGVLDDVTVPISKITDLLTGIQEISHRHGLLIGTYGHAGDGNLHPQILYDSYNTEQVKKMEMVESDLFHLAVSLNGTLTGEHGIGLSKADYMGLEHDKVEIEIMKKIKKALDPNNIMNPGKMALHW
jgi:glycolate oxidase